MFNIEGPRYGCCDRLSRRSMLKIGSLALGQLTLADALRQQSQAATSAGSSHKEMSVILLWQGGGPSHLDMWDLKPDAPSEFRGTFQPISSNLKGCDVSEHMPQVAKICDKLAIVRSTTHGDSGHESASHFLLTGYPPTNDIPSNEVPSYGSIVAKEMGPVTPKFPAYVTVPRPPKNSAAAYLGVAYNPFDTQGDPNSNDFSVRNLKLPGGLNSEQMESRLTLLKRFDRLRRDIDSSGLIEGMDTFAQQAWDMVTSPQVQKAFDLKQEDAATRDRYGRNTVGQSTLLARRLIEAGVRFVTIDTGGWDSHANNFESLKKDKLPAFDQYYSALIEDLDRRGRLDTTLILLWGEFGRTPRINPGAGRDHWPNVFTTVMAGGGLRVGQVLGASDARAEFPKERPISPQDVLATMYKQLGIDRDITYVNDANRPVPILNYGQPIKELV